jgi:hypothetical protein
MGSAEDKGVEDGVARGGYTFFYISEAVVCCFRTCIHFPSMSTRSRVPDREASRFGYTFRVFLLLADAVECLARTMIRARGPVENGSFAI